MIARYEDVIAKPVQEIFDAIANSKKMVCYFISSASGDLQEGQTITWNFADAGVQVPVKVTKVEANTCIQFQWTASDFTTSVEILLTALNESQTRISITEKEWPFNEENVVKALQQTTGWTHFTLCLKAYLLFHVNLRTGQVLPV